MKSKITYPRLLVLSFFFITSNIYAPRALALVLGPRCEALFYTPNAARKRQSAVKKGFIKIEDGREVFYEHSAPTRAKLPTFLFMPGANRMLTTEDRGVADILAQGYGVATESFSVQPSSVAALANGEKPAFISKSPTLADFAAETTALANSLRAQKKSSEIIPVSLSYSGSVSPYLRGFRVIIETAPMTSAAAASPEGARYKRLLQAGELFNPFFGPAITRGLLDKTYRENWVQQTDRIISQWNLLPERREDILSGYVAEARAQEDFSWENVTLDPGTRRIFILAGRENPVLLRDQIETFRRLLISQPNSLLFLIGESGHIVPFDQPAVYANVLNLIAGKKTSIPSGVVTIVPSTGAATARTGAAAISYLGQLLEGIGPNVDASSIAGI